MNPEVSVIIPCYNQGHFLGDSLKSASISSKQDLEIIIVNDGSTDAVTLRKLDEIVSLQQNNIRVVNQTNKGLSSARNTGVIQSSGSFIKFLDADDLLVSGSIDKQLEFFQEFPALDVVIDDFEYTDIFRSHFWREEPSTVANFDFKWEDFFSFWESGLTIPIHAALFRKNAIEKIPFHEGIKAKEDWVFWCDLAANSLSMHYTGLTGCVYRVHGSNMTKDKTKMAFYWLEAFQIILKNARKREIDIPIEDILRLQSHFNDFYARQLQEKSQNLSHETLSKILNIWN
ncbi:glycosyltransferase family 2 protein [Aurantimicrobium minutum]|uniref:Glycosyltransferase n=1 Tax=Aurantimicrobium minutum TaxID=708131 RepID=A0A173LV59_9MICO|nr:glycosyltransferase family A protein [Aurantimicrobium minutum]BAU98719.1 glycosyltransferase [Aurantimicrobium minutum]